MISQKFNRSLAFAVFFIGAPMMQNESLGADLASEATPAAMEQNIIQAQLRDATVFFSGAELTQVASAQIVKGENEIVVEGLSSSIDLNSLRIKVTKGVIISSYEFSVDHLKATQSAPPAVKQLEDSLKTKQLALEKMNIEIQILNDMRDMLLKGVTKTVAGSENGVTMEALQQSMEYYRTESAAIETQWNDLQRSTKELTAEIATVMSQLYQEKLKGSTTSGMLRLRVAAPAAQKADFEIAYYTSLAGWSPYYDINVDAIDKPLTIISKAQIMQTTGFDWKNIRLTLSSATPNDGKTAPLFKAWTLRPEIKFKLSDIVPQMVQNSVSYDEADMEMISEEVAPTGPVEPSFNPYVDVSSNAININYEIDTPYSIPGNGKVQNVDLLSNMAKAEYKYYCAPKLSSETFVVAEIPDWQRLDLMSAPANVTYDGTNIGQTEIDASSTAEKLSLTLGTDKRVVVKREKLKDFNTKSTFGSNVEQTIAYRITVKNNQKVPINMVTKEQYPLSGGKNIEVTLNEKKTTPWSANVKELGVITWEETIAPGESKVYEISYSVKYPKSLNINL